MSTSKPNPNPLYAALLEAQKEFVGINRDADNSFSGYKYTSSDHMVRQARQHLLSHGLVFAETASEVVMGDGNAVVCCTYVLSHPDTGSETTIVSQQFAEPRKGTPLDKSIAGARTVNIRDALRGLFNLPRGDSAPEPDQQDDSGYDPEVEKYGKSLVSMCGAIDFAEGLSELKPKQRLVKIAKQVGVNLGKATLDDLKKVEQRITQIIDSHPNMKIEDDK